MVDFTLTADDAAIVAMAHEQAGFYRKHAPLFDRDLTIGDAPIAIPGEEDLPHVRDAARAAKGTSGFPILDALINLEEIYGGKPMRARGRRGDTMNFFLSNSLLEKIGTEEQIAKWNGLRLCYGLTEPAAGSDAAGVRTTAVQDPATREWVINGEKIFISLGEAAEGVMVLARARNAEGHERLSNFIVEKGTPGFSVGAQHRKMGQRGVDTVNLIFDEVRVPDFNHLDGDLKRTLSILNGTRSMVAVQALGFSRAVLDFLRDRLAERGQALDYRPGVRRQSAVAARLMRLEAHYDAVWLLVMRAKWIEVVEGTAPKVEASMAKTLGGRLVRTVMQDAMDLLGPDAVSSEHLVELVFRDSRIVDIYEGPGEVQRVLLARDLLGYSAREFA